MSTPYFRQNQRTQMNWCEENAYILIENYQGIFTTEHAKLFSRNAWRVVPSQFLLPLWGSSAHGLEHPISSLRQISCFANANSVEIEVELDVGLICSAARIYQLRLRVVLLISAASCCQAGSLNYVTSSGGVLFRGSSVANVALFDPWLLNMQN